jgi:RIO kinase 1
VPLPELKDVELSPSTAKKIFDKTTEYMRRLYTPGELIHADLSEYNSLVDLAEAEPIFIDMGQSVTLEHPNAELFLNRDAKNIVMFFKKYGIGWTADELVSWIKKK